MGTDTNKLPQQGAGDRITVLRNGVHMSAMMKALKDAELFNIVSTKESHTVRTRVNGKEVLRALKKGKEDIWIIRHHEKLFL